ncbi:MAG: CDP-glucose 4,6-dehydratase [Geminicoccaceae bacterium]|nr:CDP-glucose 4,6-dehydratase [Geminicoccaceae bacterium]
MHIDPSFWLNRRVLVTGHTGFKGIWLSAWLSELGADVVGFALPPGHAASLYYLADIDKRVANVTGDIRDRDLLVRTVRQHQPEVVFHLAAQSLVLPGIKDPVLTFESNVMGTLNLLEAARHDRDLAALLVVTSDKVYAPSEQPRREGDPLGGHDPYAASKAAAELVAATYARLYLTPGDGIGVATARAGNVVGGGDFSPHRLFPDLVRAAYDDRVARIRNPEATRPWQHVLDALHGYLVLAQELARQPEAFKGAWNFGPLDEREWTVGQVADEAMPILGGSWAPDPSAGSGAKAGAEAPVLRLASDRAVRQLAWRPVLDTHRAIAWTAADYREFVEEQRADWLFRRIDAFAGRGGDHAATKRRRLSIKGDRHAVG